MKVIKIIGCSDPLLWYKEKIGDCVEFLKEYSDCYMSRDRGGFANIIRKQDGVIVEINEVFAANLITWPSTGSELPSVLQVAPKENTMNAKREEYLNILQEECAEVIQAVSKVKRFGWRSENISNLQMEVADLLCMLDMLEKYAPEIASADWNKLKLRKTSQLEKYSSLCDV